MEKDDEVKGEGNSYDFGSRIHDPRIGRFLSLDPLQTQFPNMSPYVYAANTPIMAKDEDGKFAHIIIKYGVDVGINIVTQMLTAYMFNDDVKTMSQAWDEVSMLDALGEGVVDQLGGKKLKMAANATMGIVSYLDKAGLENATIQGALTAGGIGLLEPIIGDAIAKQGLNAVKKGLQKLGLDCKTIEKITAEFACFDAGTLVSTKDGYKPIESITEDDFVWSYNEESGKTELKKVLQTYFKEVSQVLEIRTTNEVLIVTAEHPFYVNGQWIKAKELRLGTTIKSNSKTEEVVLSITSKEQNIIVYNFEVEDNHNYYVSKSQLLVHNDCGKRHNPDVPSGFYAVRDSADNMIYAGKGPEGRAIMSLHREVGDKVVAYAVEKGVGGLNVRQTAFAYEFLLMEGKEGLNNIRNSPGKKIVENLRKNNIEAYKELEKSFNEIMAKGGTEIKKEVKN